MKQERKIFEAFQDGLDRLIIPEGVTVDRFYVVNDCQELIKDIRGEHVAANTGDLYQKTHDDHIWTSQNLAKMPELRNMTIRRALDGNYDYWFSVDTDIVLRPETLQTLINAEKDIVSEIFWTRAPNGKMWCNGWMFDQYDTDGHMEEWLKPGLYRVGMTGACTLVKTEVFRAGVDYTPIPCIKRVLWGEDRWFSIRAACAGFEMWLDTHFPAVHLFTENEYQNYQRRRQNGTPRKG